MDTNTYGRWDVDKLDHNVLVTALESHGLRYTWAFGRLWAWDLWETRNSDGRVVGGALLWVDVTGWSWVRLRKGLGY